MMAITVININHHAGFRHKEFKISDAKSQPVSSNQRGPHSSLARVVSRHLASEYQRPVAAYSEQAFGAVREALATAPLVLDSFCGTGHSTLALAERHPGHLVLGVDKSAHRLGKHPAEKRPGNYLLLRADCEDIWHLLLREGLALDYHYLLYPNPWPKGKHLQRRVHGHGSFPWLLQLGGQLELRSNWQVYVEEFGSALHLAGHTSTVAMVPEGPPLTLFEDKYRRSGHPLWRCLANLAPVTNAPR